MSEDEWIEEKAERVAKILHMPLGEIDPLQLLRMYVVLYDMLGLPDDQERGDEQMRWWLNTHNNHLGFCPAARLTDEQSMSKIIGYLEGMAYH